MLQLFNNQAKYAVFYTNIKIMSLEKDLANEITEVIKVLFKSIYNTYFDICMKLLIQANI